ncbi:hypothetical protein BGP76_08680 [Reichenbachiella sp. MSK19-1]|nr:hypothetical protein BGP76_08680 [Reichenbachiella sp. MSK19-1]
MFLPCYAWADSDVEEKTTSKYSVSSKRSFADLSPFETISADPASFYHDSYVIKESDNDDLVRSEIEAVYDEVLASNRFVKFLDKNALMELPVGIKKTIGALDYTILIEKVEAYPEYSLLYASMCFESPKMGKIHFRGEGIKFSKKGGIVGDGTLYLVGDYSTLSKESMDRADKTQFIIKGTNDKTYVEFDCDGFKSFSLDASMVFSNEILQPEDANGEIIESENAKADFTTTVTDWNDLLVEVSVTPFQVKGLKDVSFSISRAVLDFSDTRNMPGVTFPADYVQQSSYHQSGTPELWRGVYIQNLTIALPHQFDTARADGKTGKRIKLMGNNMLIDDMGFTGMISGKNLIPLERGKMGKWNFSLDEISVTLVANELTEGSLAGKIDIPINNKNDQEGAEANDKKLFAYSAMVKTGNEYVFNVTTAEEINFDLWKAASVTLLPSSNVEVQVIDDRFSPSANLHGKMDITLGLNSKDGEASDKGDKNVSLAQISFQDLRIQSEKPYVKVGTFSLGVSSSGMGGFPIQINNISGGQSDDELFLGLDILLKLTGDDGGSFGAVGGFRIVSNVTESGGKVKYQYDRIEINKLGIDISQGDSFSFKGQLIFFKNDPVYGNGINGIVEAKFSSIGLQASAVFGTVEGMKYWYVDAIADLGTGIPIFTGFFITRFGGGAYYHMSLDSKGVGSELGRTSSGITYVPDKSVSLGIKAIVGVTAANEKMMFAEVTFEMAFNSGMGLKYIRFMGNAKMLSLPVDIPVEQLAGQAKSMAGSVGKKAEMSNNPNVSDEVFGSDPGDASIFGSVLIEYNFDEKSLHANLSLKVNVAGVITGGGSSVMHFDTKDWYIYIGRPERENRFNLTIMSVLRTDSYFVMGSVVPDTPPPPEEVSEILGGIDLDYMSDLNALADGAGIGFGASLTLDTGDKTFLIFYGHFKVGMGFDIMLKDYGNVRCAGSGQLGIDGWYANGQSYAYFDGLIGIKVKLFGKKKKIDIINIAAAVVMQAKLPNPVWMKGVVGGRYSVLGGAVKGECKFEVEIGEECDMITRSAGDVLEGMEVIAQLTPSDNSTNVEVFTLPQIVFNYEINKSYKLEEEDMTVQFRISAKDMKLMQGSHEIEAEIQWSDDKMTAVIYPRDILPPQTKLKLTASATFEEYKNGRWQEAKVDGEVVKQTEELSFTTGDAPSYIPEQAVTYRYPLKDMVNYYSEEYPNGFIQLNQGGYGHLFNSEDFTVEVRFITNGDEKMRKQVSYSNSKKEVTFPVPTDLMGDKVYAINLIQVPKQTTNIEANVKEDSTAVDLGDGGVTQVRSRSAEGSVEKHEEEQIYGSYFRVSRFATFPEKAAATLGTGGWFDPIEVGVHRIGTNISGTEPFAYRELKKVGGEEPLISFEADLEGNSWYEKKIYPLIYSGYPFFGTIRLSESNRSPSEYGVVPKKAVHIWQYPYSITMPESAHITGAMNLSSPEGTLSYMLAYYMYYDFLDLSNQVASKSAGKGELSERYKKMLSEQFPTIEKGDYWSIGKYTIPGRNIVSSTYRHKINNPRD